MRQNRIQNSSYSVSSSRDQVEHSFVDFPQEKLQQRNVARTCCLTQDDDWERTGFLCQLCKGVIRMLRAAGIELLFLQKLTPSTICIIPDARGYLRIDAYLKEEEK